MQEYDLVSIICPTFNCSHLICATISSVQMQTYQYWELIISDDCSTDNTDKIVESYAKDDSRIKYICNESNYGAAITRNKALAIAKGKWIAFLDSDDLWTPNKLEKQIRFMEENNYHFSYTRYCEINEVGVEMGVMISGPKHISKNRMYAFCWPGCLTVIYDNDYVGLIQIEDIKKNNDYAMWLKVCQKADCHLLDECLAKYRRGRYGSISSQGISTMIKWHFRLFHEAEHMGKIASLWHTAVNLVCGFYKKLRFVKKYEVNTK